MTITALITAPATAMVGQTINPTVTVTDTRPNSLHIRNGQSADIDLATLGVAIPFALTTAYANGIPDLNEFAYMSLEQEPHLTELTDDIISLNGSVLTINKTILRTV